MTGTSGRNSLDFRQHFKAAHAGHVDVGQDQDQRLLAGTAIRARASVPNRKIHHEALRAQVAPKLLAKQRLDIGFVIDH